MWNLSGASADDTVCDINQIMPDTDHFDIEIIGFAAGTTTVEFTADDGDTQTATPATLTVTVI